MAAQITINYFSKKESKVFQRSRYLDLQEFFKGRSKLNEDDINSCDEIRHRLAKACQLLDGKLGMIGNRAVAVSVFLFVSEFVDQGLEHELEGFPEFLVKFLKTLKWQIPKGVNMHSAYHHLLDFQTHVNQAAGERYAVPNRHNYLLEAFSFFKANGSIVGDDQYETEIGIKANDERSKY